MSERVSVYDLVSAHPVEKATGEGPHGWIQWKGTNVCMDVHCACGELTHVDADFAYVIKCGACGRMYGTGMNVVLVEIPTERRDEYLANACEPVTSDWDGDDSVPRGQGEPTP